MDLFRSAMHYLGLGPDDDYDDYDQVDDRAVQAPQVTRSAECRRYVVDSTNRERKGAP